MDQNNFLLKGGVMRGNILDFSIQENTGYISGDDGKRYTFIGREWKENAAPKKGDIVDFEADLSGNVLKIYKISSYGGALKVEAAAINDAYRKQLEIEVKYGMIAWFEKCMRNYANFSGRARRSEFWYFSLMTFLIELIPSIIISFIAYLIVDNNKDLFFNYVYYYDFGASDIYQMFGISALGAFLACWMCSIICGFIFLIPSFAVTVRRLHDIGRSGWWSLLIILTYIFSFVPFGKLFVCFPIYILFFVWACTDTKKQANQWGLPAK